MDELDPYSVDDLLTAHGIMTRGLMEESGMFRTRPVGVVDSKGNVLHFGTLPQYVPDLVMELPNWTKTTEVHMRRDLSRGVSAKKTHLYLLLLYLRAHSGTHENIFNLGLSFSNSAWTA